MRRHILHAVVIACALAAPLHAQSPVWENYYAETSQAVDVKPTSDGGYIVAAQRGGYEDSRIYLVKTDASGVAQWERSFGNSSPGADPASASAVEVAADGGYAVVGQRDSRLYMMKISAGGDSLWSLYLSGDGNGSALGIARLSDGSYAVTGYVYMPSSNYGDLYVAKISATGDILWEKTHGTAGNDGGNAVRETADGMILTGWSSTSEPGQIFLLKIDAGGNKVWDKRFTGTHGGEGKDVRVVDGGYIVTGRRAVSGTMFDTDVLLLKTDASGNTIWERTLGGAGYDGGHMVQPIEGGGYAIVGFAHTATTYEGTSLSVLRTDASGALQSEWTPYAGSGNALLMRPDGRAIVAGMVGSKAYLAEIPLGTGAPDNRMYTYTYGSVRMFDFVAERDWEASAPGQIRAASQTVTINGILKLTGTITIDTARSSRSDTAGIRMSGRLYASDVPLPGGGRGDLTVLENADVRARVGAMGLEVLSTASDPRGMRLAGVDFLPTRIQTIEPNDRSGVRMSGLFSVAGMRAARKDFNGYMRFSDLEVTHQKVNLWSIEPFIVASLSVLHQPSASYDAAGDEISISGMLQTIFMPYQDDVRALTGIRDGELLSVIFTGNVENVRTIYRGHVLRDLAGIIEYPAMNLFGLIFSDMTLSGTLVGPAYEADLFQVRPSVIALSGPTTGLRAVGLGDGFWHVGGSPEIFMGLFGFLGTTFEGDLHAGRLSDGRHVIDGRGEISIGGIAGGAYGNIAGTFTMPRRPTGDWLQLLLSLFDSMPAGESVAGKVVTIDQKRDGPVQLFISLPPGEGLTSMIDYRIDLSRREGEADFLNAASGESLERANGKSGSEQHAAGDRSEAFAIDETVNEAAVAVHRVAAGASTWLVDPNGVRIDATRPDSSVIRIDATPTETMWVLRDPIDGEWSVSMADAVAGDSAVVVRFLKPRPFDVEATQSGSSLTATWSAAGARAGAVVRVYLDRDSAGYDGVVIGETEESAGRLVFTMSDSLPECSYRLFAVRIDDARIDRDYAGATISNARSGLVAPGAVAVTYSDSNDVAVVTWTRSSDPDVAGYLVRVSDPLRGDSIYASAFADASMTAFVVAEPAGKTVEVIAHDSLGRIGCPSNAVAIVGGSSIVRDDAAALGASVGLRLAPNPAADALILELELPRAAELRIAIVDANGRTVRAIDRGRLPAGSSALSVDLEGVASGAYIVIVTADGHPSARRLSVAR